MEPSQNDRKNSNDHFDYPSNEGEAHWNTPETGEPSLESSKKRNSGKKPFLKEAGSFLKKTAKFAAFTAKETGKKVSAAYHNEENRKAVKEGVNKAVKGTVAYTKEVSAKDLSKTIYHKTKEGLTETYQMINEEKWEKENDDQAYIPIPDELPKNQPPTHSQENQIVKIDEPSENQ